MKKKWWVWLTVILIVMGTTSLQAAQFAVKDWLFVWNAAKAGNIRLRIEKDPRGTLAVLNSPGGSIATVKFPAEIGKSLGEILLKAEQYALEHKKYYEQVKKKHNLYKKEYFNKETIDGYEVIFFSEPRGENFVIKVKKKKLLTGVALMTKEEALKMGLYLMEVKGMVDHINSKVNL